MKNNIPKKIRKPEVMTPFGDSTSLEVFLSSKHQKANEFVKKVKLTF